MVRTIVYVCMNAQYRETSQDTSLGSLFNTFANCRNVFLRNSAAHNGRLELEGLLSIGIHGLEDNFTVTVLTTSAGLFCVLAVHSNLFGNSFFVCNLRRTNVCLYLELTKQTVNDDLQMEFSHTCDNGLACLMIGMSTESRILLSQLCQSLSHLALTSFGLRLDSQLDNRLRELHGLKNYRMLLIAESITGSSQLKSNGCCDISGVYLIQLCTLIGMHLQDTANTLLLTLGRVQNVRTGIHGSGIYTEECQLTNKGVSHDLEGQSGERLVI